MKPILQIVSVFLFVAIITIAIWFYWAGHTADITWWWTHGTSISKANEWGDAFGGFNALFGALGFSAVIATLLAQIKISSDQQRDQHRQRFDATFFEMLRMIRDLRAELRFVHSRDFIDLQKSKTGLSVAKEGRDAITQAATEMRFWIARIRKVRSGNKRQICIKYMTYIHGRYESRFSPYFRMLYTVMFKISNDKILSKDEKVYYGNILRSQLNKFEVALLAVNSTSPVSGDLDKYIIEFRMLKYLPNGTTRTALERIFPAETFSGRAN